MRLLIQGQLIRSLHHRHASVGEDAHRGLATRARAEGDVNVLVVRTVAEVYEARPVVVAADKYPGFDGEITTEPDVIRREDVAGRAIEIQRRARRGYLRPRAGSTIRGAR